MVVTRILHRCQKEFLEIAECIFGIEQDTARPMAILLLALGNMILESRLEDVILGLDPIEYLVRLT